MANNFKDTGRWFQTLVPKPDAALRLFCFPYAGGSVLAYRTWPQKMPPSVEVCAVQLPGRGSRITEPPYTRLGQLLEALAPAIRPYFDKPFAFFGHSMGALIGFELARLLRRERAPSPSHLFVSGGPAPQLTYGRKQLHDLPRAELLGELRRLNGTPPEVLEHPELMGVMLPLLRADFAVCDTYEYTEEPPLDVPLTVFGGLQDKECHPEDLKGWREHTSAAFSLHMLPGDHFFLRSHEPLLLSLVTRSLPLADSSG